MQIPGLLPLLRQTTVDLFFVYLDKKAYHGRIFVILWYQMPTHIKT